jgi:hypothetical protein
MSIRTSSIIRPRTGDGKMIHLAQPTGEVHALPRSRGQPLIDQPSLGLSELVGNDEAVSVMTAFDPPAPRPWAGSFGIRFESDAWELLCTRQHDSRDRFVRGALGGAVTIAFGSIAKLP